MADQVDLKEENISFVDKSTGEVIKDVSNKSLTIDPFRKNDQADRTGIYVRAQDKDGNWGNFDIAQLDGPSLLAWLRSRGGENPWAETVVATLLDHHVEGLD